MLDWTKFNQDTITGYEDVSDDASVYINEGLDIFRNIHEASVYQETDEECLERMRNREIPKKGRPTNEIASELIEGVFKKAMNVQHPRFFAFVPSAVSPYSLTGSILTDIFNLHGGGYEQAPGAFVIEEKLVDWMGSLAGYPEETRGGIFLSGGSISNLSAMIIARDTKLVPEEYLIATAYISDQTHSSVKKDLRLLGFQDKQIRIIPTDEEFKMRTDLLEETINADIEEGKKPFVVIGTIGTTNTGTVDPLDIIGEIAQRYNLWFHVDGAFGGSILVSDIYRNLAKGIELSDSLTWDTHKWLMQIYSCSTLLVRDKNRLLASFTEHPEYLMDVINEDHNDAWDLGPEMSRPFRAIKLWYTVQACGVDQLEEIIDYTSYNAYIVRNRLSQYDNWEIISKPSCGTINFRYHPEGMPEEELDRLNHRISDELIATGYAFILTTTLKNKVCLRMCTINANTKEEEILNTVDMLNEIACRLTNSFPSEWK